VTDVASPPVGAAVPALSHREIQIVFVGLMMGTFLAALDQTVVATAMPTIVGELGGLDHYSWVVTSYLLTSTVSTPLYGKISDLYGRKPTFQASILIFLAGSALAGLSRNMGQLIAFRALQGIGAGGLGALAFAITGDIVAPRNRGRYQGYIGSTFAVASIGGPLIGGFFVDHLTWRWAFYVNLPVGAVALLVTAVALNVPFRRVEHRIDYPGAALLVAGASCVLLVTVWGGQEFPWGSPVIVGLALAGVALLAVFCLWERKAAEPILPLRLFREPVFSVSAASLFIVGIGMFGAIVFVPLYLQVVKGATPTRSGLLMSPMMLSLLLVAVVTGRLMTRFGRYKVFPLVGLAVMVVGAWRLSALDTHSSMAVVSTAIVIMGVGMGMVMHVFMLATQNAVAYRDLGTATSAVTFFRSMGGALGVAVFGSILSNRLAVYLADVFPGAGRVRLEGSPAQIRALPPPVRDAVVDAVARSLHVVFLWAIPVIATAWLLTWLLRELPLRESLHDEASPSGGVAT
jgi:EmrB/QacA subfamily drug resistance transporter